MPPKNIPPPNILLEDGAVFVMNKPGGLLTQAPPGIDSLELRTKNFLKVRDKKPGKVYLGVPHRLDRPVSGVITVVKNIRAAQRISKQIQDRTVTKTYWAVVEGTLPNSDENDRATSGMSAASGMWENYMRKVPGEARSEIVDRSHADAKMAQLKYRLLGTDGKHSLLEIELITGRTHQIRLQCGSRGLPIVGDELYGAQSTFGPETSDQRKRWIALHARRLAFEHPISKLPIDETAPLPEWWDSWKNLFE